MHFFGPVLEVMAALLTVEAASERILEWISAVLFTSFSVRWLDE